jgi:uncharacterized RDD family membrane protein YckC
MTQKDAAGGREWNPYELATPVARAPAAEAPPPPPPPPLSRTPASAGASPYAAPRAHVADAAYDEGDVVLAGRIARLLAVVADTAISLIPVALLFFAGMRQLRMSSIGVQGLSTGAMTAVLLALAMLAAIVVVNIVLLVRHGQTVGKRLIGIRIVRPDGSRAGFWRIFLLRSMLIAFVQRILQAVHPLLAVAFVLTDILMIFGENRRCLHDIVADTIVVEAR